MCLLCLPLKKAVSTLLWCRAVMLSCKSVNLPPRIKARRWVAVSPFSVRIFWTKLPDLKPSEDLKLTFKEFKILQSLQSFFNFCNPSWSKATCARMCVYNKVTWSNHANLLLSVRVFPWRFFWPDVFGITRSLVSLHVQHGTLCTEGSPAAC